MTTKKREESQPPAPPVRLTEGRLGELFEQVRREGPSIRLRVLSVYEVAELLNHIEAQSTELTRLAKEVEELRALALEWKGHHKDLLEIRRREKDDLRTKLLAAESSAAAARRVALEEAAKIVAQHFGKDIETFDLPSKIRSLLPKATT